MDSIFAKTIIFFASILSVVSGPSYIKLGADNLTFDFKTGENYPIYYFLNIQNIGPKKERFETSSSQSWVSVYREGTDSTFVELPSQAYINFVLEIRPVRLSDGVNEAKVNLRVLDIDSLASQEVVLDKAEISITLNKNIVSTKSTQPIPSAITPTSTLFSSPVLTPVLMPASKPVKTQVLTPSPALPAASLSPSPEPTRISDLNPILNRIQLLINSIRSFLGGLF